MALTQSGIIQGTSQHLILALVLTLPNNFIYLQPGAHAYMLSKSYLNRNFYV